MRAESLNLIVEKNGQNFKFTTVKSVLICVHLWLKKRSHKWTQINPNKSNLFGSGQAG
jgi:hypothetical protein